MEKQMSREFGENPGGFFHTKIDNAKHDLIEESNNAFHLKFVPLLSELYELAYAISSVEAGDSCDDRSVFQAMESVPKMIKILKEIDETELSKYRRVAEEAVRHYKKKMGK